MGERAFIVAIVDDDPRLLESLENLLESAGYCVHCFAAAKALLMSEAIWKIDCVIADIGMPGMDGLELRRQARTTRPDLPVILLTGRHEIADAPRPADEAYQAVFRKPFNGPALLAAVGEALGGAGDGG